MHIEAPTGEAFEREFFGFSRDEVKSRVKRLGKMDKSAHVNEVRQMQADLKWNPRKPATKVAKALRDRVQSRVGKRKDVLLCCAIGTRLDFDKGTDLFFLCEGKCVTVDLTICPRGKENPKADFVLTLADLQNNRHYQIADAIANHLLQAA